MIAEGEKDRRTQAHRERENNVKYRDDSKKVKQNKSVRGQTFACDIMEICKRESILMHDVLIYR